MKHILFFLFSFLIYTSVRAQNVDNQLWFNYALTVPVSTNFSYGGDVGLRGFISNNVWNQILIRPTATYRWNQTWAVAGAVAWFHTFYQNQENVKEFRIHQDLNISWPSLKIVDFFYRIRIEQRWFFYPSLTNDFNVRLRYLIGAESADIKVLGDQRPIYFQFLFEGFNDFFDQAAAEVFINRTRTHFAFGHRISRYFRYEFHYIWQKSRQFSENGLETTQNIFRLRLFHRLKRKKKEEQE